MATHPFIREARMQAEIIAYLAGLFDGEGTLGVYTVNSIQYPTTTLSIKITLCDYKPLQLCKKYYGGSLFERKRLKSGRRCWQWCLYGNNRKTFLKNILPFSIIKKSQIILGLKYLKEFNFDHGGNRHGINHKRQNWFNQKFKQLKKLDCRTK